MRAYSETYRSVGFHQTTKGDWFFNNVPPAGGHRRWSEYLSPTEQKDLSLSMMRMAIDRHHDLVNRV